MEGIITGGEERVMELRDTFIEKAVRTDADSPRILAGGVKKADRSHGPNLLRKVQSGQRCVPSPLRNPNINIIAAKHFTYFI